MLKIGEHGQDPSAQGFTAVNRMVFYYTAEHHPSWGFYETEDMMGSEVLLEPEGLGLT